MVTSTFCLVAFFISATLVLAQAQDSDQQGRTTTVELQPVEVEQPIRSWSVPLLPKETPFTKERLGDFAKRGYLQFGPFATNRIGLALDRSNRKLYLDLNANNDLTDDPQGVFSAEANTSSYFQRFRNLRLAVPGSPDAPAVRIDLGFYNLDGFFPTCNVELRSFWQGKLTLGDSEYQVGVLDKLVDRSADEVELLLRPWTELAKPFSSWNQSGEVFPLSSNVFLKRNYRVELAADQASNATRSLRFSEQPTPTGELKLTGQFIQRLVLKNERTTVLLPEPGTAATIPVGTYTVFALKLKQGASEAALARGAAPHSKDIQVTAEKPTLAALGGPLTNSVSVTRRGHYLSLEHQLLGVDGRQYNLSTRNVPSFTVTKNGRQLAAGAFEYG